MSRAQTAAVVSLAVVLALAGTVAALLRGQARRRAQLLREKARDIHERAEADRVEVARREAEVARLAARARAAREEPEEQDEPVTAPSPSEQDGPQPGRDDPAEQLRRADEVDPELPTRLVAERDGGDDVR